MNSKIKWIFVIFLIVVIISTSVNANLLSVKTPSVNGETVVKTTSRSSSGSSTKIDLSPKPSIPIVIQKTKLDIQIENRNFVREKLKLSDKVKVHEDIVKLVIERDIDEIINLSGHIDEEKRPLFIKKVVQMDKKFIRRFSRKSEIKQKLDAYILSIEQPRKVKVDRVKLNSFYLQKRSIDDLMEEIWFD